MVLIQSPDYCVCEKETHGATKGETYMRMANKIKYIQLVKYAIRNREREREREREKERDRKRDKERDRERDTVNIIWKSEICKI